MPGSIIEGPVRRPVAGDPGGSAPRTAPPPVGDRGVSRTVGKRPEARGPSPPAHPGVRRLPVRGGLLPDRGGEPAGCGLRIRRRAADRLRRSRGGAADGRPSPRPARGGVPATPRRAGPRGQVQIGRTSRTERSGLPVGPGRPSRSRPPADPRADGDPRRMAPPAPCGRRVPPPARRRGVPPGVPRHPAFRRRKRADGPPSHEPSAPSVRARVSSVRLPRCGDSGPQGGVLPSPPPKPGEPEPAASRHLAVAVRLSRRVGGDAAAGGERRHHAAPRRGSAVGEPVRRDGPRREGGGGDEPPGGGGPRSAPRNGEADAQPPGFPRGAAAPWGRAGDPVPPAGGGTLVDRYDSFPEEAPHYELRAGGV